MGALRVIGIVLIVQTVVYVSLMYYLRALRRDKLEAEWDAGGIDTPRELFVRNGLEENERPMRRNLLLLVYVVPIVLICLMIYLTNFA